MSKQETKADAFARIRSGDISEADMKDERPRIRRAANVAMLLSLSLDAEGVSQLLASAAADPSDAVYLSTHRAYLRSLTL